MNEFGWNIDASYEGLPKLFYSKVKANSVASPELLLFNDDLAKDLGLHSSKLKEKLGVDIFSGNTSMIGYEFLAQAYAGHQFGSFTILGDGRAMLTGEHRTPSGNKVDIQLKGSGRTPYSRAGDGRATLSSILREYIISEAMHGLGVPTSRGLAVTLTGEKVNRGKLLDGAVLTRVSKSHIRVGTFQFAARSGSIDDVKALADYSIDRHFPEIKDRENPYLEFLKEVIKSQAYLIAKWQLVGFVHGVMNTDNMTISGETLDYGPCAFMDIYDPDTVFSSIDVYGRYAYGNQPKIGGWNLARLAETLLPLLDEDGDKSLDMAKDAINDYLKLYSSYYLKGMRLKLGILNEESDDEILIQELLELMTKYKADYTNSFLGLTLDEYKHLERSELFGSEEFKRWNDKWLSRLERQDASWDESKRVMKENNPIIIPRNLRVEEVLEAAVENRDLEPFMRFFKALSKPYDYSNVIEEYMIAPEDDGIPYKTYCGT